ncbi:hypothetical protein A2954_07380 [Candidatus Roizmanbacteria bacterium RIFCSPLOWO2_01_FULL_37_12]|uniref:Uncharacterized protein n=1 Tax=Candidatus Roizmanbacteria bacterium RIFCSPLOWO2_01_FULL_37_12 TaxID=1802056 RepID=A0A1F7IE88_9BACT|nr:MAG: hypothetical protein A3D76_04485 [Candidatus Roizmanbacteria bacterium RIFCSPHIGHO2_02_FULL_37_9b]OGK41671.1 MAG: hypothetical protein A2954_07380 [Candidatus Roizmanbacteria bacterium RIFCSPLOWO2_01_FULL_37_12]
MNKKIFIALVIILIFLIILFTTLNLANQQKQIPVTTPTPTVELLPEQFPSAVITPEIIPPTGFTGVLDEELPPEIKNESEQIQDLSNKVPLTQPQFTIDFNWDEYKFTVSLNEPKDQAKATFEEWLKNNYPAIPLDRFILK